MISGFDKHRSAYYKGCKTGSSSTQPPVVECKQSERKTHSLLILEKKNSPSKMLTSVWYDRTSFNYLEVLSRFRPVLFGDLRYGRQDQLCSISPILFERLQNYLNSHLQIHTRKCIAGDIMTGRD